MESVANLTNISVFYPGHNAAVVHSLSHAFPAHSFTAIVGPSGSGKSTVLKVLAGLVQPEGDVTLDGSIAMVFQSGALLPWKTAEENVEFGLLNSDLSSSERMHAARQALAEVGMMQFAHELPRDLSGGQRQRIGIARALATNPDILLLDEPFSALDVETTEKLHRELIALWQKRRLTVIMVSHSPDEAVLLAQSVLVMRAGRLIKEVSVTLPYPRHLDQTTMHRANEIRLLIHVR